MMVDVMFPVVGRSVPADHAYPLYSAVCRRVPDWHAMAGGMTTLGGTLDGQGGLRLLRRPVLCFRVPSESIGLLVPLGGQSLEVGEHSIQFGVPSVRMLRPATALVAHLVTVKGFMEVDAFGGACRRQLDEIGVTGKVDIGRRGILRIQGRKVVGFRTLVTELNAEESILLQERGLGGRRKMGCGVFVPAR